MSAKPKSSARERKVEDTILENYNKYYRLAYSYVHNDADAADIVQNGAYKAILNSDSLRNMEFAGTWVYRIMLNEIFRFLKATPALSLEELVVEEGKQDTYEDVDLRRAVDSLGVQDKAVVEMRFFQDMRLEEIAEILQENLSTVKSRLYRSMKKLRLELETE